MAESPLLKQQNDAKMEGGDGLRPALKSKTNEGLIRYAEQFIRFFPIIFVASLIIVIGAGILFLMTVYQANINDFNSKVALQKIILDQRQKKYDELMAVKLDYQKLGEADKKIIDALPKEKDLPGIFYQLEKLAGENGLELLSVNVAGEKEIKQEKKSKGAQFKEISFNVSAAGGDYFKFKDYLADIENNLRILDIQSIAYSPDGNNYNITMKSYYLTEE